MEAFEYKGLWWFPQFPNHQVAGLLKFDPVEGAVLEILGGEFTGEITQLFGIPDQPFQGATLLPENVVVDIICGYTNKGDAVTLWKCRKGGFNWATGYAGETYQVQAILIGCHFEKEDDILFDCISIQYTHLEQWLGITGFSGGFKISQQGDYLDGEVKYTPPERFDIRINNFKIGFYYELRVATDRFIDIKAKQVAFIEITPDLPIHYNDYHSDIIYYLRNFFSLGVGAAVLPLVVKGRKKDCVIEASKGESVPRDIYIFYTAKGASLADRKQLDRWQMFFRYQDIVDNFQYHLQTWFNKAEKLRPVLDLYFGIFYIPSMYIHLEFITLAQALETYHRRMYGGAFMEPEVYEPTRQLLNDAIPNNLDKAHQDRLKGIIQYGYEYSLRKRLKLILTEILYPYKNTVDRLVGDYNRFVGYIVDTRNYLTHYTEELEQSETTDPNKQYAFVQKMKLLMLLCLFKELDFPADTVNKILGDNNTFNIWSV